MIRILKKEDNDIVMDFVSKESEFNLFIIGDIENYGYDEEFQTLWGEFDDDGNLIAVLLKYYENRIFYSRDEYDIDGFVKILKKEDFKVLSGNKEIVKDFKKYFNFKKQRDLYFCALDKKDKLEKIDQNKNIKKLEAKDATEIMNLYNSIDEFNNFSGDAERIKKEYKEGSSTGYGIFEDGKLVSMAKTTAENKYSAMIVGVCTHPDYRKKGFASECMKKLCTNLIDEGKSLCLFYDNPSAGKIYKGIGFEDIGMWTLLNR
ncbi:MAG: GNAT family N-acetyltransferase [Firmicutes bacterium]|nr:GNAT family N-acetyltransferase [Bacillota bacterium]